MDKIEKQELEERKIKILKEIQVLEWDKGKKQIHIGQEQRLIKLKEELKLLDNPEGIENEIANEDSIGIVGDATNEINKGNMGVNEFNN